MQLIRLGQRSQCRTGTNLTLDKRASGPIHCTLCVPSASECVVDINA